MGVACGWLSTRFGVALGSHGGGLSRPQRSSDGGYLAPDCTGNPPETHPCQSRKHVRLQHFRGGSCLEPPASFAPATAFVLTDTPGVATVLLQRHSGDSPAWSRCGSRNRLCLQAFCALFSTQCVCFEFGLARTLALPLLRCVFPPDRILLAGEWAGPAEAWPAAQLRSRGDARIPLLLRHGFAVGLGSSGETGSPVQLPGRARVLRFDIQVSALLAAPHVPDPVAAAATLKTRGKTFAPGPAEGASAATAPAEQGTHPHGLTSLGIPWRESGHNSSCSIFQRGPAAWAPAFTTNGPWVPSLSATVSSFLGHILG
jgi:hypothetical protein